MVAIDQEAVARARQGDVDAFARVFEALRPSVYAVASRLAGPDDADDIVMDTYLKAWQALPSFSGRASLKSWLYRIAYNCALDLLRRRRRRQAVDVPECEAPDLLASLPDVHAVMPGDDATRTDDRQWLNQALARLPAVHRTLLQLRYSEGLSYSELAAVTHVSMGTVMSRLFHARHKLRRALEDLHPAWKEAPEGMP